MRRPPACFSFPQVQDAHTAGGRERDTSTPRFDFNHSTDHSHPMSDTAIFPEPADNILSATDELRAAAAAKAREIRDALKSDDVKAATDKVMRETAERWREVSDNAAVFIRENPGKAALAALGIGFAIGLLFRRD